jgi:glycosyltransferase involved in cell wall biosynthesis
MRELGHRVFIACQPGSGILKVAREQGIPVEEVVIRGSFDLRAIRRLRRLIRTHGIDVVHTHSGKDSWVGGFAAKWAGARLLVRSRHLSVAISKNPLNFVYRMTDGVITTGEAIRDTMIADNGMDPDRIVSIATGVSLDRFDPDRVRGEAVRAEFGIPPDAIVVTMVAVLRSMKRHDVFLGAAAQLRKDFPGIRFLIVGDGPGRASIEELIRSSGLTRDCILTGHRLDIPEILAATDIFVLTSDRFEGVPQSISQAMAMRRPVVASPIGSIPELIRTEQTGLLATTGDPESFAKEISRLICDPALRERLGAAARRHVLAGYTDDIMAARTVEFYRHLLGRKKVQSTIALSDRRQAGSSRDVRTPKDRFGFTCGDERHDLWADHESAEAGFAGPGLRGWSRSHEPAGGELV